MLRIKYLYILITLCLIVLIDSETSSSPVVDSKVDEPLNFNLEYEKYLQEVVKTLESDPEFKKKLENASPDDIKSGKIAREVDLLHHSVRTKLDELKRLELERLQELVRQQQDLRNDPSFGTRKWRTKHNDGLDDLLKKFAHLDHKNTDSFEAKDLEKLIQVAVSELSKQDELEKQQFKEYEMEKQRVYEERLANMTEEQKKNETKRHEEILEKRKDHPKIHAPGTKEQLEDVWEKQDNLPREEFDPKIFFLTHDTNGDGFWDENEMKALLKIEVDKAFEGRNADDYEKQHELEEMRRVLEEHIDTDRNRMISYHEFQEWTKKNEYQRDPEWKTAEEKDLYTRDEYNKYVEKRKHDVNNDRNDDMNYYPYRTDVDPNFYPEYYTPPPPQYYQHPGQHPGAAPGQYPPQPNVYHAPPPPPGQVPYQQGYQHPDSYQPHPAQYNQGGLPPSPGQQQGAYNPQMQHPGNYPQTNQPQIGQQNSQHPSQYNQQPLPSNQPQYQQGHPQEHIQQNPPQHNQQPNQPQYNQQPNQPAGQPQYNQQPNQPQHNQQPNQPQYNQQPNQPQYNQPAGQPQYNQQPNQPAGQPHYNQQPNQPAGQPHYNQPNNQQSGGQYNHANVAPNPNDHNQVNTGTQGVNHAKP